jgi:Zn-dependent membrane protease YugP
VKSGITLFAILAIIAILLSPTFFGIVLLTKSVILSLIAYPVVFAMTVFAYKMFKNRANKNKADSVCQP